MANYRTQIDPPMPDRERILAHRDFDSLYDQYQTQTRFEFWRNLYRKPRNFAILVMVIAVGALVIDNSQPPPEPNFALQPLDTLVFEAPTERTFTLSTADTSQLDLGPNVSLNVPARAWQDSSGKLLTGTIELQARVLRGPSEWFQAGVPRPDTGAMRYLHALHLSATQNGKPVALRPQTPLQISWQLDEQIEGIKGYRLDTSKQAWHMCAEVAWSEMAEALVATQASSMPPSTFDREAPQASTLPKKPQKPFGVDLRNPDDYPEFARYQRVYWAYIERPGSVNPWEAGLIADETPWEDVRVRKLDENELYELKFSRADRSTGRMQVQRVTVRPILEARNQADATSLYRAQLADWSAKVQRIRKADSLAQAEYKAALLAHQAAAAQQMPSDLDAASATTTTGTLTYSLSTLTLSGYWQAEVGEASQLVELGEEFEEVEAWLPWSYAVQGDQLLSLKIQEGQLYVSPDAETIFLRKDTLIQRIDLTNLP